MDQVRYILVVDDEEDMRSGLRRLIPRKVPGTEVITCGSGDEALAAIAEHPFSVALLDIKMEGMSGLELLEELRLVDPWLTVIMMTGHGTIEMAVEAIKGGAYDFISKPFDNELLQRTITKGLERNQLIRENMRLREKVRKRGDHHDFVGSSLRLKDFLYKLETVARSSYATLVHGESGTGKELTARAIHRLSGRSNKPLVMVNCPAIPENLLESELFGHVRGAFTGASQDKTGLFHEADGGTICLDEVGDLPLSTQSKLLRVLQEQEIRPIGSSTTLNIDVRVVSLTNLDLKKMIKERLFREDLYYRLNVVSLHPPPLREMKEDIPELVHHFTLQVCTELEIPPKTFCQRAISAMMEREWPGNVRQMQNVVRRVVMFAPGQIIQLEDLHFVESPPQKQSGGGLKMPSSLDYKDAKQELTDRFTEQYLKSLLNRENGNVTRAAETSGLSRAALQKIMKRYGISASTFRSSS